MNKLLASIMALTLAGCACTKCDMKNESCCDATIGNWGLDLGFPAMKAGHIIFSRDANGNAGAIMLWRWASPIPMNEVKLEGNTFSFEHPWGYSVRGFVYGSSLKAIALNKNGTVEANITGWRNPPIEKASTKDAKLGQPIDLLANGLNDWQLMGTATNGWSVREENGVKILSNKLPRKPDGKVIPGVNLMTKRSDFYDFNLEYDVCVPKGSNSGVYLRGRYECQVIDSYGKKPDCHNMGAYYGCVTPSVAAEKKPGEWQHVSVTLYKRHLTVVLNGQTIIEDAPVVGITGGAIDANEFVSGPLYLQGDHSDADYKNMILRPAK